jgi:hypothetical protein
MGHIPSLYLIQSCEFDRFYSNPMKRGGRGLKFTKWRTIDMRNTLPEAKAMWKEYFTQQDPAKVTKFRVRFKNKTVINPEGRVYEEYTQPGTGDKWMRFVEDLA